MKAHKLVKEYEQKLAREPGNVVVRLKLAAVLRELGQVGEALRQYRAVAETYHREGRLLQAVAVCRSALEIDPADFETRTLFQVIEAARTGAPDEESTHIAGEPGQADPDATPRSDDPDGLRPGGPDGLRPAGGGRGLAARLSTDGPDGLRPAGGGRGLAARLSTDGPDGLRPAGGGRGPAARQSTDGPDGLRPGGPDGLRPAGGGRGPAARQSTDGPDGLRSGGPDGLRPSGGGRGPAARLSTDRPAAGLSPDGPPTLPSTDEWDVPTKPGSEKVVRVDESDIVEELSREAERLVRAVLAQPSFRSIPDERRRDVVARFSPLRMPGGAALLRQGEPGGGLYVVMTGALRIRRKSGGRDVDVGQLDAGSFFADLSLVRGEPAAATVVAIGPTELVYVAPRDFYDLCATFPAVWDDLRRRAQSQSFLVGERL